jgi:hypothetical protein
MLCAIQGSIMNAATALEGDERGQGERRVDLRLRAIFDTALPLIAPFFDPKNSWGGHSLEHFAFRVLRENYPELSSDEIYIFVSAARRVYAARQTDDKNKGK